MATANATLPIYMPAYADRQSYLIPGESLLGDDGTTHLFTNSQHYGQPQFRSICNRLIDREHIQFFNPDRSIMCTQCVTIENIWAENAEERA